ncbi:MAG: hypothetical protein RLZZ127_1415 [Planctomycetota bacterium]|jgi:hypothetical protein
MPPIRALRPLRAVSVLPLLAAVLLAAGCGDHTHAPAAAPAAAHDHDHDHDHGIAVPETVQRNLGITWAAAEYRVVQGVVRVAGRFEADPTARRVHQAPVAGRVTMRVAPFTRVAAGQPLARIDGEAWPALQVALAENEAVAGTDAAVRTLAAAERHAQAVADGLAAWQRRAEVLGGLDQAGVGGVAERAEALVRIADLTIQAAEVEQELIRLRREAAGPGGSASTGLAAVRRRQLLAQAAAMTGLDPAALVRSDADGVPGWLALPAPEVHAAIAGVVEGDLAADGSWVEAGAVLATVTDPAGVRLRAAGLQGDLPRFRERMRGRIVAADPAAAGMIPAEVVLGPVADPVDRTVDLIALPEPGAPRPGWARPGVGAALEVIVDGGADEELAIPVAATIRDGLATVFFRRDPADPGKVERVEADLGPSDGRWVVVHSGLKEGDQVVLGGIYPLMLSQRGGGTQAGHFHADGTFHEGGH